MKKITAILLGLALLGLTGCGESSTPAAESSQPKDALIEVPADSSETEATQETEPEAEPEQESIKNNDAVRFVREEQRQSLDSEITYERTNYYNSAGDIVKTISGYPDREDKSVEEFDLEYDSSNHLLWRKPVLSDGTLGGGHQYEYDDAGNMIRDIEHSSYGMSQYYEMEYENGKLTKKTLYFSSQPNGYSSNFSQFYLSGWDEYDHDENGNIIREYVCDPEWVPEDQQERLPHRAYTYNTAQQLETEEWYNDSGELSMTISYSYNDDGEISSKTETRPDGSIINCYTYQYGQCE